jgi:hypothetical protein
MIIIEEWSLCIKSNNKHKAPETHMSLSGFVYGHPKVKDGTYIETSILTDLNISQRQATTFSGNIYYLGRPDVKWVEWLKENKYTKYTDELEKFASFILN